MKKIKLPSQLFWIHLFLISLAMLVGALIQHDLTVLISMFVLVTFSLWLLWRALLKHLRTTDKDWSYTIAELVVPSVLWLLFGFGGMFSFFFPEIVNLYGPRYEMSTVLLMYIYTGIGAICYVWAFRLGFQNKTLQQYDRSWKLMPERMVMFLLFILLAFDSYVRFDMITGGIYFAWLTPYADTIQAELRTTNTLYQLHSTLASTIIPLLVYAIITFTKKKLYKALFFTHSILIIAQGQRRDILFVAFLSFLSYAVMKNIIIRRKLLLGVLISTAVFLLFVGPVIQESRLMMRYDASSLVASKEKIAIRYLFQYIPKATLGILAGSDTYSRSIPGGSLSERAGGYMSYAANIYQSMIDGRAGLNTDQFWTALSLAVPGVLYPGKPVVDANDFVFEHFGFGRIGSDATGSPSADIFSYLHLPGIVGLFLITGAGYGFVARHLRRNYGRTGDMIMVGILPSVLPVGDAFGSYLAGLRNVLLFIALIALYVKLYRIFFGAHYTLKNSQKLNSNALKNMTPKTLKGSQ